MRPIRIELEGFTVYREKTLIDFSNLDFFVIVGRTGSGKTSIIDAMCYALYGKVPRHTKQNVHEKVLSKGSERLYVKFEFSVRNKHYTIKRFYEKKTNKSQVRFFQEGRQLNLSAKEVEKKVIDILGMDYETFTRVIVLPQGQFDRFLKPHEPKERREILNKLLGYDKLFEAISEHLKSKHDEIKQSLSSIEFELSKYKNYTSESLKLKNAEKEELEKELKSLNEELDNLEKEKNRLDILHDHYQNFQQKQKEYNELKAKEEDYKRKKNKLERAKEALEYKREWESYKETEEKLKKKEEEKENLHKEVKEIECKLERLKPQLEEYEKEYAQITHKRERYAYLHGLIVKLENLVGKQQKLTDLKREIQDLGLKEESEKNQLNELEGRINKGEEKIKEVERELENLKKRLEDLQKFLPLKEPAERKDKVEGEISNISKQVKNLEKIVEKLSIKKQVKQQELLKAHTIQIRQNLKVGDQCPVCGSIIEKLPPISEHLDFKEIEKELKNLEKEEKEKISEMEKLKGKIETLQIDLEEIKSKLGSYEPYEVIKNCEEYEETKKRIDDFEKKLSLYQKRLDEIKKEKEKVLQNLTKIQTRKKEKQNLYEEISAQIRQEQKEIINNLGLDTERLDLMSYLENVKREKSKLEEDIKKIETEYNRITNQKINLEKDKHGKEELYKKTLEEIEQLKKEKSEKAPVVYEIIKKYGTIENFEALLIDKQELEKLESETGEYEGKLHFLERTIEDLKEKVKDFTLDKYESIGEELRSLKDKRRQKQDELWQKDKEIKEIEKGIEEKKALELRKKELEKDKNVYEILKRDFESNRFPDYVSKSMLNLIAERANIYLTELSNGTYRIVLRDGNLLIYDINTEVERDVSTLSGGETFLASLALAFGVAEVLSHGATIESIFIDEGFGSLDRETRENLGDFFELIKRNAQKMVGIVSHLEDLKEKFDQRIEVEKERNTARVRVIFDGGADGT